MTVQYGEQLQEIAWDEKCNTLEKELSSPRTQLLITD
jgi:hypothetical protein